MMLNTFRIVVVIVWIGGYHHEQPLVVALLQGW